MQRISVSPSSLLVIAALLVGLPVLSAAEDRPSEKEEIVVPNLEGDVKLSVAEAVTLGLENNLALQVERYRPLIAHQAHQSSWGDFDPVGTMGYTYFSNEEPFVPSVITPSQEQSRRNSQTGDAGVTALVPYVGAQVGVDFSASKTKDLGALIQQRPVWESGFTVQASVPLLRGLVWNLPWTRVQTTRVQDRQSREQFEQRLMDVVQGLENLYWALVAAREDVIVAKKSVDLARSLLDQTVTQYEVGVTSKVQVVEAEAGLADREFQLIGAINLYRTAQDQLIDAVYGTRLVAATAFEIDPIDDPKDFIAYEIDVEEATRKAFENRPELALAAYEIERQELELKFAKNQRLPQLDFRGSYGARGRRAKGIFYDSLFAGTQQGPTNGNSIADTFTDYWTERGGQTYTLGAALTVPIGNIRARHTVSGAELTLRRLKTEELRVRQDIVLQVREAARNLKSGQEGIGAAERRRIAAEEQLRAENVKLEYGESTPFNVLEKEDDLVQAENQKTRALRIYRSSVVDLHRAQGTGLKARNIVVDDAALLR